MVHTLKVVVDEGAKLSLCDSLLNEVDGIEVDGEVSSRGAAVFDENGKIFPLFSEYLSSMVRYEKLAFATAKTYGRNLTYLLQYLRTRSDFDPLITDEVFLTLQQHVFEEYYVYLEKIEGKDTSTIRNRDATYRAFISDWLCEPNEGREALRDDDPWAQGFLSKKPKVSLVKSCSLDDLVVLMECSKYERERLVLQFIFDTGVRRSELPRVSLQDVKDALAFDSVEVISKDGDMPVSASYVPIAIAGSKGRANQLKPRQSLISKSTLNRIKRFHASPLFKRHARKFGSPANTPAFLNAEGNAYTVKSVSDLFDRLSKRAQKRGLLNRPISPHKLRHGNAYALLQSPDLGNDFLDRLVLVQKGLGHNQIDTTQMYTRIPQDIYNQLCDENGEVLTRAQKMDRIVERTQLKFKIGDTK